jgi:hypothetical protein
LQHRARVLVLIAHHDDARREFAYGAESKISTLSDALMAEARRDGWTVISMKDDWKRIFAFENNQAEFSSDPVAIRQPLSAA